MTTPEHQRNFRLAVIVLLVLAFLGPWVFDQVNVPAEFECSEPFVRLEGDFCGRPMNGFQFIRWIGLFLLFPLLPVISTLLLLLRGDHKSTQVIAILAWTLAFAGGLSMILSDPPAMLNAWGLYLFVGLSVIALIVEILMLESRKRAILS